MNVRYLSRSGNFKASPAPADLLILQALVNTRDLEAGTDELDGPDAVADWLTRHGLLTAKTTLDEDQWQSLLEIREALRAQFRAHNGAPTGNRPIAVLGRALGKPQSRFYLARDGQVVFESVETGWPGALAKLLLAISQAVKTRRWSRLKACRNDDCQWAFYDSVRNRTAKWCAPERCGNRVNLRKSRRRTGR